MMVQLSRAACQHIAYLCNERSWRDSGLINNDEAADLRITFVGAALGRGPGPYAFSFSRAQVRALDMLLTDRDPREGKLPDGTPVLGLVEQIWRLLIGGSDARDENDDLDAYAHDGGHAAGRSSPV